MTQLETTLSIVVRWAGERTLPLALRSLGHRKTPEDVHVLDNRGLPFLHALKRSFHLVSRLKSSHTLILDADIVLFPGGLGVIRQYVELHPTYFRLEFRRICKFTTIANGIHLYNNSRMREFGRDYLDDLSAELKPESMAVRRMYAAGHQLVQKVGPTVGWHDFGQSPGHIREKMAMRALRNPELIGHLYSLQSKNPRDHEFVYALEGFERGLRTGRDGLTPRGR